LLAVVISASHEIKTHTHTKMTKQLYLAKIDSHENKQKQKHSQWAYTRTILM
jgi:hypothetical protein